MQNSIGKKLCSIVVLLLCSFWSIAQPEAGNGKSAVTNLMESNGKIYVVVAVLVVILLGLVFYVVSLDRKLGKLEKEQHR
jgi:CcmD family protein